MNARNYIRANEGCTLTAVKDSVGWEIGYGHNTPSVKEGMVWTQGQADAQFETDFTIASEQAAADIGPAFWGGLNDVRQAALTDMAYEMGGRGLAWFHNMIAAVRLGQWDTAAAECLSRNPMPTGGVLKRAQANAEMLRTGQWQGS